MLSSAPADAYGKSNTAFRLRRFRLVHMASLCTSRHACVPRSRVSFAGSLFAGVAVVSPGLDRTSRASWPSSPKAHRPLSCQSGFPADLRGLQGLWAALGASDAAPQRCGTRIFGAGPALGTPRIQAAEQTGRSKAVAHTSSARAASVARPLELKAKASVKASIKVAVRLAWYGQRPRAGAGCAARTVQLRVRRGPAVALG